jgi:hypothetical protein
MSMATVLAQRQVELTTSPFVPLALGFFGLGVGYLIYGPEELFRLPKRSRAVDITTGLWGIWMPGFLQFVTGVLLFVGLMWFHTFREPPLFMAAVAFTAYGVHWWSLGKRARAHAHPSRGTGRAGPGLLPPGSRRMAHVPDVGGRAAGRNRHQAPALSIAPSRMMSEVRGPAGS